MKNLKDIGVKLRTINHTPGYPTGPLPGSLGLPALRQTPAEPPGGRVVLITQGPSYTHDHRNQCAPGEQPYGAGFAAAGVGVDVLTGQGWRDA